MDAAKAYQPTVAFSLLSVFLMSGGLYFDEFVEPFLLATLASMAALILVPTRPAGETTFWDTVFKAYILTLAVPFAVICAVVKTSQMFPVPVEDSMQAVIGLSFTLWACLLVFVSVPLMIRPGLEDWISKNRGRTVLKVVKVDDWIRVAAEVFWIAFLIIFFKLTI